MAKKSWINDAQRQHKFSTQNYNRCQLCGRRRGYMRKFVICRFGFRENARHGYIPGVRKSSW